MINNCSGMAITVDGYCNVHKNFTNMDFDIIHQYIENKISEINPIDNIDKLNKFIKLVKYLLYRIEFIMKHIEILDIIIKKLEIFYYNFKEIIPKNSKIEKDIIDLYIKVNFTLDDIVAGNIEINTDLYNNDML